MKISKVLTGDQGKCVLYQNNDLIRKLNETYKFENAYVPNGIDVAFLLIEENYIDSNKDIWKAVFFKKKLNIGEGTITLDNFNDNEGSYEYEFYKELDANYPEVLKILCDLINKHIAS